MELAGERKKARSPTPRLLGNHSADLGVEPELRERRTKKVAGGSLGPGPRRPLSFIAT